MAREMNRQVGERWGVRQTARIETRKFKSQLGREKYIWGLDS